MRFVLPLALLAFCCPSATAEEQTNEEVVKALRAAISAKRVQDRDKLVEEFLKRGDLDWPSVKAALTKGPYYQQPMVTQVGERGSGKHYGIRFQGDDSKMRGFSLYVPRSYDVKKKAPVLVYLHHDAGRLNNPNQGAERAGVAMFRFREVCEEHGVFFLAPYTCKGAEWWTPEGKRLVRWCLEQVRRRFNLDENRVSLMGALDGGDAVWYLGQEMPGTFAALMPMTGDPYEITAIVQPLCLGTLDRADFLIGVPGKTRSTVGEKNALQFLQGLKPMVDQSMRLTTAIFPRSQGDFAYLEKIRGRVISFVVQKERKAYANEVDVETTREDGLRSLWLKNHGIDKDGDVAHNFKSTVLTWKAPKQKAPTKRLGIGVRKNAGWDVGVTVTSVAAGARDANLINGDIVLSIDGVRVKDLDNVKNAVQAVEWGQEARLVLAREVKKSDLAREQDTQKKYLLIRKKIKELRAAGKPIPRDTNELIEDDDACGCGCDDNDECGEIEIEVGGGNINKNALKKGKTEDTVIFIFERWVKVQRPGGVIVRRDFGAGQDLGFRFEGVKVSYVFAGSLADRSGLKAGDVIVQAGSDQVKSIHDLKKYFKDYKFEDAPEDDRFVDLTVRTDQGDGKFGEDRTVHIEWNRPVGSRVDARWEKKENTLHVLARKSSGFTVYFHDELIEPGKEFHLFINGVPYNDCVDPGTMPDYPKITAGSDALERDRLYRMRRKRALIKGWTPDVKLAVMDYVENRDRELILGGQMSFDLKKMKAGMKAYRTKVKSSSGNEKGERIKKALDKHLAKG